VIIQGHQECPFRKPKTSPAKKIPENSPSIKYFISGARDMARQKPSVANFPLPSPFPPSSPSLSYLLFSPLKPSLPLSSFP